MSKLGAAQKLLKKLESEGRKAFQKQFKKEASAMGRGEAPSRELDKLREAWQGVAKQSPESSKAFKAGNARAGTSGTTRMRNLDRKVRSGKASEKELRELKKLQEVQFEGVMSAADEAAGVQQLFGTAGKGSSKGLSRTQHDAITRDALGMDDLLSAAAPAAGGIDSESLGGQIMSMFLPGEIPDIGGGRSLVDPEAEHDQARDAMQSALAAARQ